MNVKNLTSFPFGPKLTSRRPPQLEMMLAVRGGFALRPGAPLSPLPAGLHGQGSLRPEVYHPDDDERAGEALYPGDFADIKLRGEVMLRGRCHAAGKKPLKECLARLCVGSWSKTLRVTGARFWSDGLVQAASEPLPFTEVPLDYAHAFGGPGHADNPVGKGLASLELPNVELASAPLRRRGDRPEPASFGPLSSRWPQRAGKVGREYGAAYQKTRAPFYAVDFDWSYFNAAPPNQWLEGYLRGDEEVTFQNLHAASPLFSVRLPAVRVRAFVKDDTNGLREVRMSLDTLFAAPDEGRLFLTWRGLTPVREDDFRDVRTLLIASEPLDAPLPEAHYRDALEAFEKDPRGIEEALRAVPEHLRDQARRVLTGEPSGPEPPPGAPPAGAPPAEVVAATLKSMGGLGPQEAARVQQALEQAIAKVGPRADVGAILSSSFPGVASGGAPGGSPADVVKQLGAQLEAVKKVAAARGLPTSGLDALDALLAHPDLRQGLAPPGSAPPPEPGPGVDCAGRDLGGQDLSDRDLRGANLKGAILSGAILRRARLAGANLEGASLDGANLDGADLSRANLTQAVFARVSARGASFEGATLDRAVFQEADLSGAKLDGAAGRMAQLAHVDLGGASARRVRLCNVSIREANLEQADFSGAGLVQCGILECRARGVLLTRAFVPLTSFAGSDLRGAKLGMSSGEQTVWTGSQLVGADLRGAVLPSAHFMEVNGAGAVFSGADLRDARFHRALLEHADLSRCNLFGANFYKAVLTGTKFMDSNLFEARFVDVSGKGADFGGANLKRAVFEPA